MITVKLDLTQEEWDAIRTDGKASGSEELKRILSAVVGPAPSKTVFQVVDMKTETVSMTDEGKEILPKRTKETVVAEVPTLPRQPASPPVKVTAPPKRVSSARKSFVGTPKP